MRRFCRGLVIFIVIVLSSWLRNVSAQVVNMPDANLRAAVQDALDLGPNVSITRQVIQKLLILDVENVNNLNGLEHATQLTKLTLLNHNISDLRPLAGLTSLTSLDLTGNGIIDIRPLAGLMNLTDLDLTNSEIRDFTPLTRLSNLRVLGLFDAQIDNIDLTSIARLTSLNSLGLGFNDISDVTPLVRLTNLTWLSLIYNDISDVTPLTHLTNLTWLALRENPIQDTSPLAALTKLRNVDIEIPITPVAGIISDPNLAAVVRDTLGLAPNARVTRQALQRLTSLNARSYKVEITGKIRNISGLEHATQLTELWLTDNQIRDIGPLAGLTQLRTLDLENNQIRDIGPLAGLTQLRTLNMWNNPITDFRPLARLQQLIALIANVKQVRDLQDHVDLTRLTELQLNGTGQQIRDTHVLANLTQLRVLQVSFAQVRDLSFLRNLTRLERLSLRGNQLSDLKPIVGLKQLKRLYIHDNQIRNLQPLTGLIQLTELDLARNQVRDVSPLAGLVNIEDLRLIGNPIQDASPLSNLPKLRYVDIEIPGEIVNMPDPNLAAAVRKALDLGANAPITQQALRRLTRLEARESQIKNLAGLEYATQLTVLLLNKNQIRNISPLAGLTRLKRLDVDDNQISNITPLVGLTQLEGLYIGSNQKGQLNNQDVQLLSNLTQLRWLSLFGNQISNIKPLARLTKLEGLWIGDNQIRDVSPLVGLVNLETLQLRGNPIQDTSPLANLTKLREVDIEISKPTLGSIVKIPDPNLAAAVRKALGLKANAPITQQAMRRLTRLETRESNIKNLTGLEHATQLQSLFLGRNQINNYVPLGQLPKLKTLYIWANNISDLNVLPLIPELEFLDLNWNAISDVSPLAEFTNLKELWLQGNKLANTSTLFQLHNGKFPPDEEVEVIEERDNLNRTYTLLVFRSLDLKVRVNPDAVIFRSANSIQNVQPPSAIDVLKVPTTGTWLFVHKPSNLTPDNFTIGPGEFAVLVHQGEQNATRKANFKTYASYYAHDGNAELPNLSHFFQNGGRIELVSHASHNPLPRDTKEPEFGDIVISEIMWGLNRSSPAKQYIELYNASAHTYTFTNGDISFRFSKASESPLPAGVFPLPPNPGAHIKVVDRVSNKEWKVPGKSGNIAENKPLVSMYRGINYTAGTVPDGTLARSWKASEERVNLPAPSYGTPGARHLPPRPVVLVAASQRPPIYWIDADAGTLHRLIGDEVENLLPGVQNAISLAVANNKIYWTEDADGDTDAVKRANLDGSNVRVLTSLQSIATSIAVDTVNSKLYWTNSRGRIQTMNFDGGAVTNLIQNLKGPNNITLDTAGSKLYWGESDSIWRADLNGRNREEFAPNLGELRSIAIAGSRIYSIERPADEQHWQLRSSTLDGLTPTQTLATLQSKPLGLAVDTTEGKLYWTNADGKIQRANLNGENIQNVVTRLSAPGHIVLGIPTSTNPAAPGNTALVTHQLPMETRLLANYPNPFNPETWIPYQLAADTDVQILIYDTRGSIVRRLGLGHQLAGIYTDRSQAAYWDGRNTLGEPVASGLYFYQLQTDTVSLLRKMLIVK